MYDYDRVAYGKRTRRIRRRKGAEQVALLQEPVSS
jgi:hypothetical protein